MKNSSDKEALKPAKSGPLWPLDLIRAIGGRAKYFEKTAGLQRLLAVLASASPHQLAEPAICAYGWALVAALTPADFVATQVRGDQRYDVYELGWRGQRLQLALSVYSFAGQPPLLLIAIDPDPAPPR